MPKLKITHDLLPLIKMFLNEIKKGKHIQSNGKVIKSETIRNYYYMEYHLQRFSQVKNFHLRIKNCYNLTKAEFKAESNYWKSFYYEFTNYLYDYKGHHDNYVGRIIKLLRTFFNYLNTEKGYNTGMFYKKFYAPHEETEIIVLSPDRMHELIFDNGKSTLLNKKQIEVKDVFTFGYAVALRFSDLMSLTKANLEMVNGNVYLKTISRKTSTYTKVKLPNYALNILTKYSARYTKKILPTFNKVYMNNRLKEIMEVYGYTEEIERKRMKRGIPETIYKDKLSKKTFRFCDAVSTHTMRRSAITNLLSLGLKEQVVRQISGHAPNSKEFYRYVSFAQAYMDHEIDEIYQRFDLNESKGKNNL